MTWPLIRKATVHAFGLAGLDVLVGQDGSP